MTYVVNLTHWLDDDGWPATPVRRQALKIARMVEYGGPLGVGYSRPTLIECSRRINRRPCEGLLWVRKINATTLEAYCADCDRDHYVITGWETTLWADGPLEPLPPPRMPSPAPVGERN